MLSLGTIGFAAPWLLVALAALPVLWWLLRVTPPAPKRQRFPAIRLLFELARREETPSRTPWWLLLLRLIAAAILIVALAQPVLNPRELAPGSGPVLLVVDDGWPSGPDWTLRQRALDQIVDRAERAGRNVALLATAADERGQPPAVTPAMPAPEMRQRLAALRPKPWAPDREAARAALRAFQPPGTVSAYWLSDGIEHAREAADRHGDLADELQRLGSLVVLAAPREQPTRLMLAPRSEAGQIVARLAQTPSAIAGEVAVLARTADGRTLARIELAFPPGATAA
ncbi:MAG: hypothetical protein FJX19_09485, partial [Alphaproteobacteria bacterium]|nr:hypothetical protein [Alphaproteobacteria bacterium]